MAGIYAVWFAPKDRNRMRWHKQRCRRVWLPGRSIHPALALAQATPPRITSDIMIYQIIYLYVLKLIGFNFNTIGLGYAAYFV